MKGETAEISSVNAEELAESKSKALLAARDAVRPAPVPVPPLEKTRCEGRRLTDRLSNRGVDKHGSSRGRTDGQKRNFNGENP